METKSFEDLEVWKRACRLAVEVCVATHDSRDFALKDQIQRSAISVLSNIAEGAERDTTGDFIRFLRYSKGSSGELRTQLYISQRIRQALGVPPIENMDGMIEETRELSSMLRGMIRSLEHRLTS